MSNPTLIALVLTDYVAAGQSLQPSVIGISAPIEADNCYECHVSLPDRATPYKIYGQDTLQAIGLAFGFLRTRVLDMQDKGDRFYFPDTDDLIPFDSYFPPNGTK